MNCKGQIIGFLGSVIVFLIVWALFFASWVNEWANTLIESNNLQGIEAFLIANLNIWIFIFLVISIFLFLGFGGRN